MFRPKYTDLSGQIFNDLKVIRYLGTKHDCALWLCRCYCGRYVEYTIAQLRRTDRAVKSCGKCEYDHRWPSEYITWKNMRRRCDDSSSKDYPNYGGRGIIYVDRWKKFIFFMEDMGIKESYGLTLERKDNDGNYCKENCKWVTRFEQNQNKRNVKSIQEFLNELSARND